MLTSFRIQGLVIEVGSITTYSKFQSRDLVVLTEERNSYNGEVYSEYVVLKAQNSGIVLLQELTPGMIVDVQFRITGNKVNKDGRTSYYTSLVLNRVSILFDPNINII